ncbi:MAG: hypothetical protein ABF969_15570, partial [Sporolactobacillus sp.]
MIETLYNTTKRNSSIINLKADYMTMAQEYFKRAIIQIAAFSILSFLNYILQYGISFINISTKL